MKKLPAFLTVSCLLLLGAVSLLFPQLGVTQATQAPDFNDVPAFHAQPPSGELPPTMAPSMFNDRVVFNAYVAASQVSKVLDQQPCYCHCDRSHGHGSLFDCFTSRHGSGCGTCIKEAFYAFEQTRAGKTPAQIREAIIRGDWQKVDLVKYQNETLPAAK